MNRVHPPETRGNRHGSREGRGFPNLLPCEISTLHLPSRDSAHAERACRSVLSRCVATLAFLLAVAVPGWSADSYERRLVEAWRERQAEVLDLERKFQGSIGGASLLELGRVGFILEQTWPISRRFLDRDDHEFVFHAVREQSEKEIEANLPALVTYLKLSTSAQAFLPVARSRKPLLGRRKGIDTLAAIAREVYEFRSRQLQRIHAGQIAPGQVLTKANLGIFGERGTLQRLEIAYEEGQRQFSLQRNLIVLAVLAVQLHIGLLVALWIRRRNDSLVVVQGRA
jgi:hypothetical protein